MGLFSFFQKKQTVSQEVKGEADLELYTPISGNLISLEEVPDLVISERLIGDGVAVVPNKGANTIVSPCSGTISRLIASNNAFAVRTEQGVEVYVTFGIGTSSFTGEGMTAIAKLGQQVSTGDPVLKLDIDKVSKDLESTVTSLIVVKSSASIAKVISSSGNAEAGKDPCSWVILQDEQ